jgi:hypothetical protein
MAIRRASLIPFFVLLLASVLPAQTLHLVPAPRNLEANAGSFAVSAETRIVVGARHAIEDRFAAEQIAEEIESATGHKVRVTVSAVAPGP